MVDTAGVTSGRDDDWMQELVNTAGVKEDTEAQGKVIAVDGIAMWLAHLRLEIVQ